MRAGEDQSKGITDNDLGEAVAVSVQEAVQGPPKWADSCESYDDLARIVAAWPSLPAEVRHGVVGTVKAMTAG
jgi:hypothetical protein